MPHIAFIYENRQKTFFKIRLIQSTYSDICSFNKGNELQKCSFTKFQIHKISVFVLLPLKGLRQFLK